MAGDILQKKEKNKHNEYKNAGQSDKSLAIESTNEQLNYVRWTPKVQDEMRNHLFFLRRELKLSYMKLYSIKFSLPPFSFICDRRRTGNMAAVILTK